jgi:hypothetical protein
MSVIAGCLAVHSTPNIATYFRVRQPWSAGPLPIGICRHSGTMRSTTANLSGIKLIGYSCRACRSGHLTAAARRLQGRSAADHGHQSLSLDDRFLYVSCFGTGEFLQYDVSDPFHPRKTGSVHLGGIVRKAAHPKQPKTPLNGAPQMVELSRDGKRIYFTNSLYASWDAQFYPEGIKSWMVKLDAKPGGGMEIDPQFFVDFGELRGHQVRLEGGDASSDSYCYA